MTIKVFYSDQVGAPTLNGLVGSLIAVLDACLVDGYNQVNVASITRTGSLVTVQTSTAHGYTGPMDNYWSQGGVGNIATIAGATQSAYNGEWPVTVVNPTTFTFDIGTATPASPATGTITTKRAPGGFSKAFSDSNRGVYRSNDLSSRRFYLQVNDVADNANGQGARFAWWRGYEVMRGIDDGDYPFPNFVQSGYQAQQIRKSSALDTTSRRWTLVTDGKAFWFQTHPDVGGASTSVSGWSGGNWFGDFMPLAPDGYAVLINGDNSGATAYNINTSCGMLYPSGTTSPNPTSGSGWACIPRKYNGQATPVWAAGLLAMGLSNNCMGQNAYLSYPDPFANRLHVSQMKIFDGSIFRGLLPLYESASGVVHSDREIVTNLVGREGRKMLYLRGSSYHSTYVGGIYIDITGESNGKWS